MKQSLIGRLQAWFRGHDKASLSFLVIASVVGLMFVFITPLLWGADETTHVGRVYQLSQGQIFAEKVNDGYIYDTTGGHGFGGYVPINLKEFIMYVNYDFNVNNKQTIGGIKWVDTPQDYDRLGGKPLDSPKVAYNFSNTAIYSPVAYIPAVIGFKLGELLKLSLGNIIYLSRIFDLVFYVTVIYLLLRALRATAFKWVVFAVALLPSSLFQASIVTADTVTIALALVIVGLVAKVLIRKKALSRSELLAVVASAALLPVAKPSYVLIPFLTLLIPARLIPLSRFARLVMPAAIIAGLGIFIVWQLRTAYLVDASKLIIAGVVPWWQNIDEAAQKTFILHHPVEFMTAFWRTFITDDGVMLDSLLGRLGFNYIPVPSISMLLSVAAMVLAVFASERFARQKRGILLAATIIAGTIALVYAVLYITISEVGMKTIVGVQGRYFLPLLPVGLFLAAYGLKMRIPTGRLHYRKVAITIVAMTVVSLLLAVIKYRYVTWG